MMITRFQETVDPAIPDEDLTPVRRNLLRLFGYEFSLPQVGQVVVSRKVLAGSYFPDSIALEREIELATVVPRWLSDFYHRIGDTDSIVEPSKAFNFGPADIFKYILDNSQFQYTVVLQGGSVVKDATPGGATGWATVISMDGISEMTVSDWLAAQSSQYTKRLDQLLIAEIEEVFGGLGALADRYDAKTVAFLWGLQEMLKESFSCATDVFFAGLTDGAESDIVALLKCLPSSEKYLAYIQVD